MSTFRVLQFNMQFGQGWEEREPDNARIDVAASIAEIQRQNADIILLQEVERAQPGGVQLDPPPNYSRIAAALTGYHGWFSYPRADARELPFGIGLAILSRTPLRHCTRLELPSPPVEFMFDGRKTTPTDRLLIGAQTTVGEREIQIYNTHLLAFFMLGTSSVTHPIQREMVAEQLAASRLPTLLGGDFNVCHHESLVAQFSAHGYATVQDRQITWRRRPYVLDHLFYNPPLRAVEHAVVPTTASDHHLLVADFAFAS